MQIQQHTIVLENLNWYKKVSKGFKTIGIIVSTDNNNSGKNTNSFFISVFLYFYLTTEISFTHRR
jgi:hypothetical protein